MSSGLISQLATEDSAYYARGREVFIRLSLLALLSVSCVLLLLPFLNLIICGIIIAVGMYPAHCMLTRALRGRAKLSATLCSVVLLMVLIVPSVLLGGTLADGVKSMTQQLQSGELHIPPPPAGLNKLPLVGPRLEKAWSESSSDVSKLVARFRPEIQKSIPALLSAGAGIGGAIFLFVCAIILAGFLLATSEANGRFAGKVFLRIFGDQGLEFKELVASTIRTVATGILGVAVIQTVFAGLGFWIAGLPGAGLWAIIFLIASVLQVGAVAMLPAVILGFAMFSTTRALVFLGWCVIVGLMDNVLKPILLGRGAKVPMPVIFLGVLGGFVFLNSIIGLFVGAIVLSVGYKLFIAWLDNGVPTEVAREETVAVP